ncbi:hypothetical protein SS50377_23817 [Spironucleus salmonicida]|uniref:Uncharacterized protein n=1 Tax=Spironucleus salmonicida TaxID=348837 RepID=V6LS27_9EUKA|nr:hypothetical protein SS50377_23817 [Spironucleus salmonicida]|eukprot:EST46496.1 Hypothetical protein SS50377_13577 [Spironucleus salmonicida]
MTSRRRRVSGDIQQVATPPIPQINDQQMIQDSLNISTVISQQALSTTQITPQLPVAEVQRIPNIPLQQEIIFNQTPPPFNSEEMRIPSQDPLNQLQPLSHRRRKSTVGSENNQQFNVQSQFIQQSQQQNDFSQAESFFDMVNEIADTQVDSEIVPKNQHSSSSLNLPTHQRQRSVEIDFPNCTPSLLEQTHANHPEPELFFGAEIANTSSTAQTRRRKMQIQQPQQGDSQQYFAQQKHTDNINLTNDSFSNSTSIPPPIPPPVFQQNFSKTENQKIHPYQPVFQQQEQQISIPPIKDIKQNILQQQIVQKLIVISDAQQAQFFVPPPIPVQVYQAQNQLQQPPTLSQSIQQNVFIPQQQQTSSIVIPNHIINQTSGTSKLSSLFPLYQISQLQQVIDHCKLNVQNQGISQLFYAAILYRLGDKSIIFQLIQQQVQFGTQFCDINNYIKHNQLDKALATAVINNLPVQQTIANNIINNIKQTNLYTDQFLDILQKDSPHQEFLSYLTLNNQYELAFSLLVMLNYVFEPTENFGFKVENSVNFSIENWTEISELIEFSQLVLLHNNIPILPLNNSHLETLPFCPFLLEAKLNKGETNSYYNLILLNHFQTVLKKLSGRPIKNINFQQNKYSKFVFLSSAEMQQYCQENGKKLYNFRDLSLTLELNEKTNEIGKFLDVQGVSKLSDILNKGLGKLLGTTH